MELWLQMTPQAFWFPLLLCSLSLLLWFRLSEVGVVLDTITASLHCSASFLPPEPRSLPGRELLVRWPTFSPDLLPGLPHAAHTAPTSRHTVPRILGWWLGSALGTRSCGGGLPLSQCCRRESIQITGHGWDSLIRLVFRVDQ